MAAKRKWHRTLTGRFSLLVVAAILATSVGVTAYYLYMEKEHRYRDLNRRGGILATMMAENGEYGVYTRDPKTLQSILMGIDSDPEVVYAAFLDQDRRRILFRSKNPSLGFPELDILEGAVSPGDILFRSYRPAESTHTMVDILIPVISEASSDAEGMLFAVDSTPKRIGYVQLGLTRELIDRETRHFLLSIVQVTLFLFLLGAVPTVLMTRRITRPIRQLASFTRTVSEGGLGERIDIREGGEVADLAGSFNEMLERLGTSRSQLEERSEALRSANEQLFLLLGSLPVVVYTCEASGDFPATYISGNALEVTGYPPEAFLSDPTFWAGNIHPEDVTAVFEVLRKVLEKGQFEHEYRWRTADGSYRWFRDSLRLVRTPEGEIRHIVGVWEDISRSREEAEARALLSMAVEQAAETILITDRQGLIQYVNPAFERISGYSRDEVVGKTPRILRSGHQDAEFYREMWETLSRGEVWSGNFVNRSKDGKLFQETAVISPVRDRGGRIVHFVAVKRDMTSEVQLEEQLRQSQKMEAVGKLAGGIAHDFNNLLTAITGYSEILLGRLPPGDSARKEVEGIKGAGERAALLTRQLLAFSRKQMLEMKVVDLRSTIYGMGNLLRRVIGEDVEIVTKAAEDLWKVRVDPGQIEQVVMNIVVNARDAMPGGGRLTIEIDNVMVEPDYIRHRPVVSPGPYVVMSISDTGCGMTEEVQSRIFEPFFTTKELGKGTGLGLSTVYGIVKQFRGYIWVYSEVDRGTTFKVYLPRSEEQVEKAACAERPLLEGVRGSETILLAEDEELVRDLIRSVLGGNGYRVLEARDGREALEILKTHPGTIHLLVTDVVMPRMGGQELAASAAGIRPLMKLLFMSGYTENAIVQQGVLEPGTAFLQKPFQPSLLAKKVRQILDG